MVTIREIASGLKANWDWGRDPEIGNPFCMMGRYLKYQVFNMWWAHSRLNRNGFRVGDIYEDCAYHPVLCTEAADGDLWGVSLIDGSYPRGCSVFHCGPKRLTVEQAYQMRVNWTPGTDKVDWS